MDPIGYGVTGAAVVDVQMRLSNLGYSMGARGIDGWYGNATKEAVNIFQRDAKLPETGVVDQRTWWAIVERSYALGERLLYLRWPFLRGADILELQQLLAFLGFRVGPIDGIFGPGTDKAVREFQRNLILPLDGIVGQGTLSSLENLQSILKLHPRTVMSWSLTQPQERSGWPSSRPVSIRYLKAADKNLTRGRKRLAAQIAALLKVAGAHINVKGVGPEGIAETDPTGVVLGIGFEIDSPATEIMVNFPDGDKDLSVLAGYIQSSIKAIYGRSAKLAPRNGSLPATGVFLSLPEAEEGEMLVDELVRQRMAVAIVDSLERRYFESGEAQSHDAGSSSME